MDIKAWRAYFKSKFANMSLKEKTRRDKMRAERAERAKAFFAGCATQEEKDERLRSSYQNI